MDFSRTSEQDLIFDTAKRFATDKLAPQYLASDDKDALSPALLQEMGELGLIGADLPEKFGGSGLNMVSVGIIAEAIAYADFNMAYIQLLASLLGGIVVTHGSEELANEIIPDVIAGRCVIGLGLTEPDSGSDAAALKLKATREGDDYILNGEKTSMSMATQVQQMIIIARTGTVKDGAGGVTAFLVDANSEGISRRNYKDLGSSTIGRGSVFFDNVRVPTSRRLGGEGMGFKHIMQGFDFSRAFIGLQCVAAAQASVDESWEYSTERTAFGKPLSHFQGVTQPLAEAETYLQAARLLCYQTLDLRDRDQPHSAEAAMCKWWPPKIAFETIHRCLLTHGHSGYSKDLPHQKRLRDVLGLQIGDGTEQIQKLVIARNKIGRQMVP